MSSRHLQRNAAYTGHALDELEAATKRRKPRKPRMARALTGVAS